MSNAKSAAVLLAIIVLILLGAAGFVLLLPVLALGFAEFILKYGLGLLVLGALLLATAVIGVIALMVYYVATKPGVPKPAPLGTSYALKKVKGVK